MHEDLLGYLLNALEPDEMQRVADWLRRDASAREELARLEAALRPLEDHPDTTCSPPGDLVPRTLDSLPPRSSDSNTAGEATDPSRNHLPEESKAVTLAPMREQVEPRRGWRASWFDWVGGAISVAVLLGLLLPSIARGRFEARKIACQDQLRQLGTALTRFVNRSEQAKLPAIAKRGPEAFAGMYAIRLSEAGLLEDPQLRWCPSRTMPDPVTAMDRTVVMSVADVQTLHRAASDRLREIQRFAGGHYAYSLGVMDRDGYTPARFESRATFAVMSDAPPGYPLDRSGAPFLSHSGRGINVLYEDGRVQFVPITDLDRLPDHPLRNHWGQGEAGVTVDDASLAPSWQPPFLDAVQR
jgi:hypothetical protein